MDRRSKKPIYLLPLKRLGKYEHSCPSDILAESAGARKNKRQNWKPIFLRASEFQLNFKFEGGFKLQIPGMQTGNKGPCLNI